MDVTAHVALANEPLALAESSALPGAIRSGEMRPSMVGPRDEKYATVVVGSDPDSEAPTAMPFLKTAGKPIDISP